MTKIKISVIFVAAAMMLVTVIGCGGKTEQVSVKEMMARAQELQEKQNFGEAIKAYKQVVSQYPKTREGANSQFMIGFLYGNYLNDHENAKAALETFLADFSEYADSGLVRGAEFELQFMGKSIDEIPILSGLGDKNEAADTTAQ